MLNVFYRAYFKLNILSRLRAKGSFYLSYNTATMLLVMFLGGIGLTGWCGYRLAYHHYVQNQDPLWMEWQHYLQIDRNQLKALETQTEQHLGVLTQYMGSIKANLIRINALGERLVEYAQLDPAEFDFQSISMDHHENLLPTLKALDADLEKRFAALSTLQLSLQTKIGKRELTLEGKGKQAVDGMISSFFGYRQDPMTGRKAWHSGVDIVAEEGSQVKALASGVIRVASTKGGYGQLVEIDHGNGLSTCYGHNKALFVTEGQLVKKGQVIASLGSTGRSTGPHLHLEVHKEGRPVDPGTFFPDLRRG